MVSWKRPSSRFAADAQHNTRPAIGGRWPRHRNPTPQPVHRPSAPWPEDRETAAAPPHWIAWVRQPLRICRASRAAPAGLWRAAGPPFLRGPRSYARTPSRLRWPYRRLGLVAAACRPGVGHLLLEGRVQRRRLECPGHGRGDLRSACGASRRGENPVPTRNITESKTQFRNARHIRQQGLRWGAKASPASSACRP